MSGADCCHSPVCSCFASEFRLVVSDVYVDDELIVDQQEVRKYVS